MHITTYLREEGVGTLYTYRLALAVNLYSHRKEELQQTVPDVVWARDSFTQGGPVKTKSS